MLSNKCLVAYRKQYPEEGCSFNVPEALLCISNKTTNEKRMSPRDEGDLAFFDRLERSKAAGRNLFYEEWPEIPKTPKDWIL